MKSPVLPAAESGVSRGVHMTERSPSGLWRVFSPSASAGPSSTSKSSSGSGTHQAVPSSSSTSGLHRAVPSSSGSGLRPTPSRGLPTDPAAKALALLEVAEADCQRGQWASAENTLRVALTFAPQDRVISRRLAEVVATRDLQRRQAQAAPR